jgi:hypothetical protein
MCEVCSDLEKAIALCERIIAKALDPEVLREAVDVLSDAFAERYRRHPETRPGPTASRELLEGTD